MNSPRQERLLQVDERAISADQTNDSHVESQGKPAINIEKIRSWLSLCQSSHSACKSANGQFEVPTRLIDTKTDDNTLDVVLRERIDTPEPYIILSYCWGGSLPLRTLQNNLSSHKKRIRWSALPLVFRQVISLARHLKIRYVWIDALCIIQEDMMDWTLEGSKMGSYYGGALLTVAANASSGTTVSCFPRSVTRPSVVDVKGGEVKIEISKVPMHFSMEKTRFVKDTPLAMPLFSRAWAFQERLMSARILHLGPEELVWECSSDLRCECCLSPGVFYGTPAPLIESFRTSHYTELLSGDLGEYWHDLIEMYLIRSLTFENDKLKAIMGLAEQVKNSQKENVSMLGSYILGLWSSTLENSLLWSNLGDSPSRNSRFPSWSWASIEGSWQYQRPPPASEFVSRASILKTPPHSWDTDPTVPASDYELVISGHALKGVLSASKVPKGQGLVHWALCTGLECDKDPDLLLSLDSKSDCNIQRPALSVTCLQLGISKIYSKTRTWGLILQARQGDRTSFERIGIMTASEDWYKTSVWNHSIRIL
ncbi:hypothetical protein NW768_001015 [Fusarium equiseti]|uniref:Heterokaryon incompatibility domain-containing protein n=1 Tax=Fusarium equiseti TaxID=61235 RepID=A0ABQ8RUT7_FUSEQ|nr:hypothetical protein NW768_001015 [Fusarium equiseti]